jgi:hypothetical protein
MRLFRGLIGLAVGALQWLFVVEATVMLLARQAGAIHIKPDQRWPFIEMVIPGCLIVAWWLCRVAREQYRRLQFWWWWRA